MKTHELNINISTPGELGFWLNFHKMSAEVLHQIDTLPTIERSSSIDRYFETVQMQIQDETEKLLIEVETQRQGEREFLKLAFTVIIKGLFEKHQRDRKKVLQEIRDHKDLFEPHKEIVNQVYKNEIHN